MKEEDRQMLEEALRERSNAQARFEVVVANVAHRVKDNDRVAEVIRETPDTVARILHKYLDEYRGE